MKIGDVVYSTKIRPNEHATISNVEVVIKDRVNKNGTVKKETRTTYTANYKDGSILKFYGFDILKTVFKYEEPDGQISFDLVLEGGVNAL